MIASRALKTLFFTVFADMLGIGILFPVIPLLLADPRSSFYLLPEGWTVSQGYFLLGILTSIFPLMQFFSAPILGQLSDKLGRRPVLAFSLAGTTFAHALFGVGILLRNIPLLFIARALDGLTGGNISVAQAAIADVTKPEDRAKNFGMIGAAFGLGFILGPWLGGKFSDPTLVSWFNAATPFWLATLISFLNVCAVLAFLPETRAVRREVTLRFSQSIHNIIRAANLTTLRGLFLTSFLFQGGFAFFTTFFGVFLIRRFGFTPGQTGNLFALVGICTVITQAIITRQVAKRYNERDVLRVMLFLMVLVMIAYYLPQAPWQIYLVTPFFSMVTGLINANLTGVISRSADASVQGEVLGINASVQALGQTIPPVISAFLASSLHPDAPMFTSFVVLFLAACAFTFIALPALRLHQSKSSS